MKSRLFAPLAMATALIVTTLAAGAQTQPPATSPDAATAPASERHWHMPDAEQQLRHMTKLLNLTDAQQQQLRPILVDRDKQIQAIHGDTTLTPQQQHQNMAKLMQDTRSQIDSVLTDAQRQQLQQAREHRHSAPASQPAPATQPPPSK